MASRHTGPGRIGLSLLPVLLAVVILAGCGGSSGVHTQTPTSDSPTPSTSTTPSTTATTPSTSSTAPSSSTHTFPPPTVTPPAQDAVNSYYADYNAGTAANRDPAHADLTWISTYETGDVRTQTEQSFAYMKSHQLAFRGAAPNPSVKVQSVLSPKVLILTSCLVTDKSDPWIEYSTATGKAVPTGTPRNPPPPYLLRIFMKASSGSTWQITSVLQDTSKTCTG
jgi:cytoskeletal protein RodZ